MTYNGMTYEEAIKYAKDTCYCAGCPIDMSSIGDEDPCSSCKHREFFELAIEALEKQIPKKVVYVHPLQEDDGGDYMCPSCQRGTVYDAYGRESAFCPYCGQALDWSEGGTQ